MIPCVLTIAGSDSGGGAGVQADLKTFTVFRTYGMSVLTALTAQNTRGVIDIHTVPAAFVRAQIDAVAGDFTIKAAKTGMLATAEIITVVATALRQHGIAPLVVDPVMVAQSGARLLADDARAVFVRQMLPLATLVTPNLREAEALSGLAVNTVDEMRRAARVLVGFGATACLVKGGHLENDEAVDVLDDGNQSYLLSAPRIATPHTHGTGCQLSAAITANLALGASLRDAVECGKRFITAAIRQGLPIGHGNGPANPLAWLDE